MRRFHTSHLLSPVSPFFHLEIIKTNRIFLDNYAAIYFLAVTIKQSFKSEDKYLVKVACTLLSL